jgi:replicative DNA helicase
MSADLVVPPHANDAEQAVLGAVLLVPESLVKVSDWLPESAFYRKDHQAIWRAVTSLGAQGRPFDAVTLCDWFAGNGLADVVPPAYMIELANMTGSAANVVAYAEIVAEKARLRETMDIAARLGEKSLQPAAQSADVIAEATHALAMLGGSISRGGLQGPKPILRALLDDVEERLASGTRMTGTPTPWHALNEATHGLQPGELVVLAGRPNMGKSVAGVQLAAFSALRGTPTLFFSLEMTAKAVMRRAMSAIGPIPHDWLMAPDKDAKDLYGYPVDYPQRMECAGRELAKATLLIDETPALAVEQIAARAKRAHLQQSVGLVIVDHMHIVRTKGVDYVRELGAVSRGLKALAKDLRCPVIALAQLNRALAARTDKRPGMTDLRASGEIEQDADLILFLHREDYYAPETHLRGVIEMSIGKGRDIESGKTICLANRFDEMRMDDWRGPLPEAPAKQAASKKEGPRLLDYAKLRSGEAA